MKKLKALLAAATVVPALALAMPAPYRASYDVLRNGERAGQTTVSLKSMGDGRAELHSSTNGSDGLAALTGASVDERSVLRWNQGVPETVSWD